MKSFDLRGLGTQILGGEGIGEVLERFDWRGFEAAVAEVFVENGFIVSRNFRFKTSRRYEVDVIASKQFNEVSHVMSVDCKSWGRGRNKTSGLRSALGKQEQRTMELKRFVTINPIAQCGLGIREDNVFHTALVTLFEENIVPQLEDLGDFDEINRPSIVIPIEKLNSFLNDGFFDRIESD